MGNSSSAAEPHRPQRLPGDPGWMVAFDSSHLLRHWQSWSRIEAFQLEMPIGDLKFSRLRLAGPTTNTFDDDLRDRATLETMYRYLVGR
jgi:hypothetical protein